MASDRLRLSDDRERELLAAALDVLRDVGYGRFTVDAVVARARASKTTVYRRWPTKERLVAAAFRATLADAPEPADHGSLPADLVEILTGLRVELDRYGDVIAGLVGELRRSPELAVAIREDYVTGRVQAVVRAVERARERGEIAPGTDIELLWQLGPAVLFYRVLLADEPVDDALVRDLVDLIARAAG